MRSDDPTHFEIPVDDGPALYYLGTDKTLVRLDFPMPANLGPGAIATLDIIKREAALCRALIGLALQRLDQLDKEQST